MEKPVEDPGGAASPATGKTTNKKQCRVQRNGKGRRSKTVRPYVKCCKKDDITTT